MDTAEGSCNSHNTAVNCLQKVYRNVNSGFGNDFAADCVDPGNLQYGEVTYTGMEALYTALRLKRGDVFYDLGSGVGKLVLYVALRGEVLRSVGLEVGERRHALADSACQRLAKQVEVQGTPCADFAVMLADISRQHYNDATVVVMTNLCMDMGIINRTLNALMKCPSLKRIVCITPMPPHSRLNLSRIVKVHCTWAKTSSWQVYDVLEPQMRPSLTRLRSASTTPPGSAHASRSLSSSSGRQCLPRLSHSSSGPFLRNRTLDPSSWMRSSRPLQERETKAKGLPPEGSGIGL
mmetsp:Transcript_11557/g.24322  ORF Transcript_11557/g.24322 Transcript_11557/m.24322 type:complete len:293 (+) Transcript_11557:138-1016(+)